MKVLYEEGVTIHFGLKLCVDVQRWRGEALAEVRTGAVMSSEITAWECRPYTTVGKATWAGAITRVPVQLSGVRDLWHVRMHHEREPGELGGDWQSVPGQSGGRRPEAVVLHVRCRAVGQVRITCEAIEQRSFNHAGCDHGSAEIVEVRGLTKGNLI